MPGIDGYNLERLENLRVKVEAEAKLGKHDQSWWGKFWGDAAETFHWDGEGDYGAVSCPSSACAAGWTTVNEGAKMLVEYSKATGRFSTEASHCLLLDGSVRNISDYAAELLGLDRAEANILFDGSPSSRETLRNIDELIIAAKHGRTWHQQQRCGRLPIPELELS